MDLSRYRSSPVIIALLLAGNALGAQAWYSPITIDHSKVGGSSQTDFPVLIGQTDNRFKTIGNGGHVNNANGYDLRPYSDAGLSSALTYELERYNATTGEVVMWVKIPSLGGVSGGSDTVIYLGYGDTGLTTDGSSGSGTFSNSFKVATHLKDGTTLSAVNSVGGTTDAISTTQPTPTPGQIDGGAAFSGGSSRYVNNDGISSPGTNMSVTAWVKATAFTNAYGTVVGGTQSGAHPTALYVKSNGKLAIYVWNGVSAHVSYDGTGTATLSTGTWYHLGFTYNTSTGLKGYVNATQDGTGAATGTGPQTVSVYAGYDPVTSGREWNGIIDEMRVYNATLSADWITTEYNNGFPATFETLGTEVSTTSTRSGWFNFIP